MGKPVPRIGFTQGVANGTLCKGACVAGTALARGPGACARGRDLVKGARSRHDGAGERDWPRPRVQRAVPARRRRGRTMFSTRATMRPLFWDGGKRNMRFLGTKGFSMISPSAFIFSIAFFAASARPACPPPLSRLIMSAMLASSFCCRWYAAICDVICAPGPDDRSLSRASPNHTAGRAPQLGRSEIRPNGARGLQSTYPAGQMKAAGTHRPTDFIWPTRGGFLGPPPRRDASLR